MEGKHGRVAVENAPGLRAWRPLTKGLSHAAAWARAGRRAGSVLAEAFAGVAVVLGASRCRWGVREAVAGRWRRPVRVRRGGG